MDRFLIQSVNKIPVDIDVHDDGNPCSTRVLKPSLKVLKHSMSISDVTSNLVRWEICDKEAEKMEGWYEKILFGRKK